MGNTDTTSRITTPTAASDDDTFVVEEREGLQLHSKRNVLQLGAVLASVAVGAIIGYFLTDERPDLAALAGGVVGMLFGAFVSGFILMHLPTPTVTMTLGEIRHKRHRLKRRVIIAAIAFGLLILSLPLIISRFGHDDSTFAWTMCLVWIGATLGSYFYASLLAYRLHEWQCPLCSKPFGKRSTSCDSCGLSLNPESEKAT